MINTNHTIESGDKRSTYAMCTKCKTDTIETLTHSTLIIILFVKKLKYFFFQRNFFLKEFF